MIGWRTGSSPRVGGSGPIHRLILTSAAYQQSTTHDPRKAKLDPDNRLLWRQRPRRLEAESIRDSILAVGGGLDRTLFGPAVFPYIPPEAALSATRSPWENTTKDSPDTWRRSIYVSPSGRCSYRCSSRLTGPTPTPRPAVAI